MDKKPTKNPAEKDTCTSETALSIHKEKTPSNGSSPIHENSDKKNVTETPDVGPSAQDKLADVKELAIQTQSEKDIALHMDSDDEDMLLEFKTEDFLKESEVKAVAKKSEKYFSDIESSDDSIGYDTELKAGVTSATKTAEAADKLKTASENDSQNEAKKKKELELEPVESDEDYFEDSLSLGAVEPVSDEEMCEAEGNVDETLKQNESPTHLLDEKGDESKEEEKDANSDDSMKEGNKKELPKSTEVVVSTESIPTELDKNDDTNDLLSENENEEAVPAFDATKTNETKESSVKEQEVENQIEESTNLEGDDESESKETAQNSVEIEDEVKTQNSSESDEDLECPIPEEKITSQKASDSIESSSDSSAPLIADENSKKMTESIASDDKISTTLVLNDDTANECKGEAASDSEKALETVDTPKDDLKDISTLSEQKEPSSTLSEAMLTDDDEEIAQVEVSSKNKETFSETAVEEKTLESTTRSTEQLSEHLELSDNNSPEEMETTEDRSKTLEVSENSLVEGLQSSDNKNTTEDMSIDEEQKLEELSQIPEVDTISGDIEMVSVDCETSQKTTPLSTEESEIALEPAEDVEKVDPKADDKECPEKENEANDGNETEGTKSCKSNEIVSKVVDELKQSDNSPETLESHNSTLSESLQSDSLKLNEAEATDEVESTVTVPPDSPKNQLVAVESSAEAEKVELIAKDEDVVEIVVSTEKDIPDVASSVISSENSNLDKSSSSEENQKAIPLLAGDETDIVMAEVVETPEVQAEVVVEKTTETPLPNEKTDAALTEAIASKKSLKETEPEVIEIDDDDEDNSVINEKEEVSVEKISKPEEESVSQSKEQDGLSSTAVQDKETEAIPQEGKQTVPETNKPIDEEKTTDKEKETASKQLPNDDEEDEPLLMIDESHKEDNEADENNYNDTETATSAPSTDSSSEGSFEVFHDKECVNYECKRACKNFYRATMFTLNYFKISKKRTKVQFVCEDCYDRALGSYEALCKTLKQKQPLLHGNTFDCPEFVEIIDSSDEEESDTGGDKVKDENELPKETIQMLEAELEGTIRKVMQNVDIHNQLTWTKQILQQRLNNLEDDATFVTDQLRMLQKKADTMHNSLYQCPKIKLRQLTPLDLNSGRMYNPESDNSANLPPLGEVKRSNICVNEQYYAVKNKAIASWVPCKVIEEVESYPKLYSKQPKNFKIKFTKSKYPMLKTVSAKHMAFFDAPKVRLPIGSRVIAYFDATSLSRGKEKMLIPSAFYPGIIAEPLKQSNKFRYLVFYDDGYFQYVNHKDVRLVCQASENVWEDVHHQSREFIHNYLTQYAVNRPMVQTSKGQSMLVDYNGKWIYARVIDVDCSLVQMLFEGQSRSEWIYRGSTRLGPVYKESNNLSQKSTLNATRRRTEPFIRYINGDDSSSSQQVQETEEPQQKSGEPRSVAKKSVSRTDQNSNTNTTAAAQPVPTVRHLNNSVIFVDDDNKPKGKVVYYTARKNLPPRDYVPHLCSPACPFNVTHNLSFYSPLAKPLLSGWERQVFRQKSKKFIVYRGPCGKRMRNIEELHRYLRVTDNELNVDNFDFSSETNCLAEYVLEKCLVNKKDISCGKEKMPIPCVNYYDESMPPACEYSAERIPTAGVPLNLDEEFMCGCDCEDDCSDKTKCACWELTYVGAKYGMPTVPTEMVGYQYKRLYEHVPTGIYECNSRCKCKANCVNRVVQQPLQSKLQVFKTSNRGWGLRCINDVPRGSFICVYAGQLLTEQVANEGGLDAGDEYFAELDYIEVAEQIKEGYESDVHEPDDDEDFYSADRDDDDFDFRAPNDSGRDKEFTTRLRARRSTKSSSDVEHDSQERQTISFEPNKTMDTSNDPTSEKPTIRKLFGKDECCYVMDAKVRGNLGRYFNHSCSPNLFVQNVFVDTHDLRFPWVAFFASTHIRAGTELTWNYNYEVGVVPGKVLYCQCGAPNCRQRLL